MKRFIYNRCSTNYKNAAIRIMDEILNYIPSEKHIIVFIFQDLNILENLPSGVYYVTDKLPVNANVIKSDVKHYFYRYVVLNKKKRIQTYLIPRIPIE